MDWRRVNFLYQKAKNKYKKRKLPKKYNEVQSFYKKVVAAYNIKPTEHFKNSGLMTFWSIQTDHTHNKAGVIKVSKTKLEDPALKIRTRQDYQRVAGADDIFQGSKADLLQYIKNKYRNFKTIEFIDS